MNPFKNIRQNIGQKAKNTGKIIQTVAQPYLQFKPETKEIILTEKMVLFLCKQTELRSDKIKSLKPDKEQGLIAEIKQKEFNITLNFTPEYIKLKEDI